MPDSIPKKSGSIAPYLAGLIGTNALDLGTTKAALDSGDTHESNPLLGNSFGQIAATKSALSIPSILGAALLNKNHPKLARGIAIAGMAVPGLAAYHNFKLMQQNGNKDR